MSDVRALLLPLRSLHERIRDAVVLACERQSAEMSAVAHEGAGDTLYAVDRVGERRLLELVERELAPFLPLVLVCEGLAAQAVVVPEGATERDADFRLIVDPIDGTRGLMYQKRSAWVLTGVAPNQGAATRLSDIVLAVQTEIPLLKQHLSDVLWAVRGEGAFAERHDRLSGARHALELRPSQARTIAHGFATISRFFPGAREELAAIDEELVRDVLGPVRPGKAHCFEDQYICTGGQLYELMAGHDRFIADLRPLMEEVLHRRGLALGICCHPYDVCTELIARELGVIVTDAKGAPLDAPLDLESDVAWAGYANEAIRAEIAPRLLTVLKARGLL